ncbi:MAG: hypothetical protein ACO4AI_02630 [Prochlorothrix sp.]
MAILASVSTEMVDRISRSRCVIYWKFGQDPSPRPAIEHLDELGWAASPQPNPDSAVGTAVKIWINRGVPQLFSIPLSFTP